MNDRKKEKLFYLDFIRVISMLMIVTYHFYAHFSENNITGFKTLFSSGKWGLIGVTLFFMVSGASLMYNYEETIDIKQYMKKRFLGIYPMFWIAYTVLFIYLFYINKSNIWGLPAYKLILSLFAMDGYLQAYMPTFYLIGEWFLGCIVIIYILFPLLRMLVKKYPKVILPVATILNLIVLIFYTNGKMPINQNLIVAVYSFILGMYIIKIKEFKIWQVAIALVVAIICYRIFAFDINMNMKVLVANLIGYNLFIVLSYIGQKLKNITIRRIFENVSKYTYAIFLVHHYLIMNIESTFRDKEFGIFETVLLYLTCWLAIIIFAKLLYMTNKSILNFFKKEDKIQ
jgi:peptidoglycan/LPS O-acetylase OafA/YrhL